MKHQYNGGNPEQQLADYLAKNGMKLTNQRRMILSAFYEAQGHLSAEELYQQLRSVDASLGQATVYRTLKLMKDAGLAREHRFGDDVTRFEPRLGDGHHDHLICDECGATVPVFNAQIEALQAQLANEHGYKPTSHRMYLYGICPDCQKKRN